MNSYVQNNMNTESNTLGSVGSIRIVIAGDGATGKTCLMYAYVKNQFLPNYEPTTFDQNHVEVTINRDKYTVMTRVGLTNTIFFPTCSTLTDIAGQHEYAKLREPAYANVDVFVLTYSSLCRDSFANIKNYWVPEIHHFNERRNQPEKPSNAVRSSFKKILNRTKSPKDNNSSSNSSSNNNNKSSNHTQPLPVPTILVSTKIDLREQQTSSASTVSYAEGERLKEEIGAKCFVECSALTQENIKAVFDNALLICLQSNPDLLTSNNRQFMTTDRNLAEDSRARPISEGDNRNAAGKKKGWFCCSQ